MIERISAFAIVSLALNPSMVWTASELGVACELHGDGLSSEASLTRVAPDGTRLDSGTLVSENGFYIEFPSLAWTGSVYGVAWGQLSLWNSAIYLAVVSADGNEVGPPMKISESDWTIYAKMPSLAWTGSEFGVAWYDERSGSQELYFARVGCP
ncbi:MAG: hypothetical protein ABIJ56_16005 [Pseudomonadota bacterium]